MTRAMHDDQLELDVTIVNALINVQFPRWRTLPVRRIATAGTVNALFRLGESLVARFPLRTRDPEHVETELRREATVLAELADHAGVPAPRPKALGRPGHGYPLPWAVQTWIPGEVATPTSVAGSTAFAEDLAGLIGRLRAVDTRGRFFTGTGRGGELPDHDAWVETCFERSEPLLDVPPLRRIWAQLRTLPRPTTDVMSHTDLIPGNILASNGRLAGILDGGGFGPADPALDLVAGWHLLDAPAREVLRTELACGDIEWDRGAAWALQQAIGLVWYYNDTNPVMAHLGRSTLARLAATYT
ncbi:aminoglycoside phosphotransferase family protein [Phytoactinopolyspora mesophila]